MKYRNYCYLGLIFIFVMTILTSCAPSALIPILKPAEINLKGVNKIAVGKIDGNIGYQVADLLTNRLFESDKFTVVDKQTIDIMLIKHQILTSSGSVDTDAAKKISELIGQACLVIGNANMDYELNRITGKPWQDKQGRFHKTYKVKGTAKVNSMLKVIALNTGQVLAVKSMSEEASGLNSKQNMWPHDPDKDVIVSKAVNKMVDKFMKMIAPYTDYISVQFEKSDLPESEAGVNFAKQGLWQDALEQFNFAKDKSPMESSSWYNLGLAYEYNYMFRQAIDAFKQANKIKPSEKYIAEIGNVNRMESERKRLEDQGAINSN